MSIKESDSISEQRTQFFFEDKTEHVAKVNLPNLAYPNQYIDTT